MKLSALKNFLTNAESLHIKLPNGEFVPSHFHITEMGLLTKHFMDCGGTVREEKFASIQVWTANDLEHRLDPQKVLAIIAVSEKIVGNDDLDIEIEYQSETIGKYGVEALDGNLVLTVKKTNCLANDHCGIPADKIKMPLPELVVAGESCCTPGGGCC